MAFKSEFPALSASFTRINQLAAREDEASTKAISDLVMRDFALTQKLLRIVNSSAYGAGKVTRISQAITILGLSQLRAVATGMMLASGGTGPKRSAIESTITESFVAGVIARNIGRMLGSKGAEELFICGMFSRLGELLTLNYLGDDHEIVMAMIADEGLDAATASQQVLGLSFDQLGAEVAAHWKFPELIVQALHALPAGRVAPAQTDAERMRLCTAYARELCAFARVSPAGSREREFENHRRRYADAVAVDPAQVRLLIGHSVKAALQYVKASGLTVAKTPLLPAMRALAEPPAPAASGAQAGAAGDSVAASDAGRDAQYGALDTAACELPPATVAAVPTAEPKPRATSPTGAVAALIRAWRALF
jgi:HD-like signal output (HDOD) protein